MNSWVPSSLLFVFSSHEATRVKLLVFLSRVHLVLYYSFSCLSLGRGGLLPASQGRNAKRDRQVFFFFAFLHPTFSYDL